MKLTDGKLTTDGVHGNGERLHDYGRPLPEPFHAPIEP